jgi:hypothetical protein
MEPALPLTQSAGLFVARVVVELDPTWFGKARACKPHLCRLREERKHLRFSRLNNAAPNRVMYELIHGMNPQLKHDSGPVRFDGSGANAQGGRYFLIAFAQREQLNDQKLRLSPGIRGVTSRSLGESSSNRGFLVAVAGPPERFPKWGSFMALVGLLKEVSPMDSLPADSVPSIRTESANNLWDHISRLLRWVISNTIAAASDKLSDESFTGKQLVIHWPSCVRVGKRALIS